MRAHVVSDLETLKVLAHPLRVTVLGELRKHGPATASELARAIGESSGSLSYHLRQLERYGFVVDDASRDGRERRWRAAHDVTTLPDGLQETAEGRAALGVIKNVQQEHLARQLAAAERDPGGPFEHSDYFLRLDPADVEQLMGELHEVVARYVGRSGSHEIALHLMALPAEES